MKQIAQTERLILRELSPTDAEFILHLVNTPPWLQFIGDKGVRTLEDAITYIVEGQVKSYREKGLGMWLIELRKDKTPIGMMGLVDRPELEDVDIGFALLPEFFGQGYAYEAAIATMQFAREELGLKRVVAITDQDNESSVRLLERIGLTFEKLIPFGLFDKQVQLFVWEAETT